MKRASWLPLVAFLAASPAACGGSAPPSKPTTAYKEPHWQDVLDATPELMIVVRPKALRQSKAFGPMLARALEVVRQKSAIVATTPVDVLRDCDEIVIAMRPERADGPSEAVVALRGVRADADPAKLVDARGDRVWGQGPRGAVRELTRERDPQGGALPASLFELSGHTWVVTAGDARARARQVYAHPFGRPALTLDPDALAIVRIDGPSIVSRLWQLGPHGALDAIGRKLQSVTFDLRPGADGVARAVFAYEAEDAAAFAELRARDWVSALAKKKPEKGLGAWLSGGKVDREGKRVVVTAGLPLQVLDGLLQANAAPDLDVPAP